MAEGNPFADLIPQQSGAGFTGYIPGVPRPAKVDDPLDIENKQLTNQKLRADLAKSDAEANAEKDKLKDAIAGLGLDELLMGVKRARDAVGTGRATGVTGALLGMVPGTTAADLRSEGGYLDQIQGGIIMEKLQSLKDASKTGASGMGALSEREGARMAASVTALGKNMSDEALNKAFSDIERHAKTLQAVRDGMDPRDPAVQKKYGIPQLDADIWGADVPGAAPPDAPPPGTPPKEAKPQTVEGLYEGGPQSDAGMGELDAKQKQAYSAFWKANPSPTPAALSTFLSGIGVPNVREADAANIIKGVKSGLGYSTAIDRTSAARAEIVRQNALRGPLAESGGETLERSGQSMGLSDEASGIGRGLSKAVQGENPFTGYVLGRDAERLRIEDARRQLGWTGTAIEVAGGLGAAQIGSAVSATGLTGRELAAQGARGGLAGGALAGFGGGEGTQNSITGALVGGAGGAAVGGALGGLAGRLGRQAARPDVARAAADEGVDLPAMMVTGSRRDINRAGALESGGGEAPVVIQEGFADVGRAVEGRTAALGGGGTGRSEEAIGESVQRAGRRFIQRSKGVADRLYNRARNLAGDARIVPTDAIRQVDEELASLQGNPGVNRAEISFLETLKSDLSTPGGKTVDELRGLRTSLRGSISNADLTATQAEARALRVMDAVHNDARANLPRGAADAFRRADMYYRERMVHIDDVLDRFIGGERGVAKLSGEQAFRKVKSMADSDGRRLAAIMRDLTGPERQDVAATIAQSLGRTADDAPFTVDQFLRQTNKFSPSARRTIFGPDGAQSIENLRVLSRRLQEIQGQVNRARTGNVVSRTLRAQAGNIITALLTGGGGLTGGGAGAMTGAATGVAINSVLQATGAVRRQLSARALMSPRVTNWLLRASNVNTPRQAQEVVRSLGTVIAREPALANELTPIQRFLSDRVSPAAAASNPEQGGADNEQR
jgi:hypothetical protein